MVQSKKTVVAGRRGHGLLTAAGGRAHAGVVEGVEPWRKTRRRWRGGAVEPWRKTKGCGCVCRGRRRGSGKDRGAEGLGE
ncbi:hypothetical protein ACFX13_029523 [Malus domestica]